jgi:hypothetical protein
VIAGLALALLLPAAGASQVEAPLAWLPPELRRGVSVTRGAQPCVDPGAPAAVDTAAGRIELCAGDAPSLRRQVLFGALLIADARAGWSRAAGWRRLNGWARSPWGWAARNEDPAAYATPAGRRSPADDLASFAAAWIAERHTRAAQADGVLECRLLPQAVFVHARLRTMALPPALRPPPRCRAFEAWARRERVTGVEIGLALPSTVSMASMFGHVFLRLVETAEAGEPALEDRTLAFLVDNPVPIEEEPLYAWKGISGAYRATLIERSLLETYRTYVVTEGRDLRRYRLHLLPAETEALLQRLWSLRQAGAYRYYFFGTNCATLMVDLINSVLPDQRQVQVPRAVATTPAGTLEGYALARTGDGRALLTFIPETVLSYEHEARLATEARERTWRQLQAEGLAGDGWWRAVRSGSPEVRAAAYRTLAAGPLAGRREIRELLRRSAIVEVHLSAQANRAAEEERLRQRREKLQAEVARLWRQLQPPGGDCADAAVLAELTGEDPEARRRGYRRLGERLGRCRDGASADHLRRLALLSSEARHDDELIAPQLRDVLFFPDRERTLGQQRYAAGVAELLDHPFVTEVSGPLLAIQEAQARLTMPAERTPERIRQDEGALRRQEELRLHERAVPRTGIDELELGMGLDRGARAGGAGGSGARALLVLGGAMHDERLGDQRRFGFPAHTALTVARTRTALALMGGRPAVAAWEATVLAYRSLPPPGSGRRRGEEVYADLAGRPRAGSSGQARVGAGWLLPLLASADLGHHLMASLGPVGTFDRAGGVNRWGIGGALGLEARRALDPANQAAWVSARASLRSLATTAGPRAEVAAGAELRLPVRARLSLPFASEGARGLGLRLHATVFAPTLRGPRVSATIDGQLGLSVAIE